MKDEKSILIPLIGTLLLWGSSFPAIKIALLHYSPVQVAVIRFIFASLTLVILSYKTKLHLPKLREIPIFLALSVIGIFGYHLLLNYGENLTNAGTTGFIVNTMPVFSLFLSYFFLKEKLTFLKLLGASISLFGVWLIIQSTGVHIKINTGITILMLAALSWSCFFIIQKILLKKYTAIEVTCYGVWIATFLFILFNNPINTFSVIFGTHHFPAILACVYLGVFATSIANWWWACVLKKIAVSTACIYTYCVPFISATLAYCFIGEYYSIWFLLGGSCIVMGMWVANNVTCFKSKRR